jgi:hypothetical protein
MPFDGSDSPALRRHLLIRALRDEDARPASFSWDFGVMERPNGCGAVGCAVGLAHQMGLSAKPESYAVADAIGISRRAARKIFIPLRLRRRYGVRRWAEVTPAMVADQLEAL